MSLQIGDRGWALSLARAWLAAGPLEGLGDSPVRRTPHPPASQPWPPLLATAKEQDRNQKHIFQASANLPLTKESHGVELRLKKPGN